MNINNQTIIGALVAEDYRTAAIFKKHGIDFCCNGNRSIADACIDKKIDAQLLITSLLQTAAHNNSIIADYNGWPLDLLADYIEKKHHRYVQTSIQDIVPFLQKVAKVHGANHPELILVEKLFMESAQELTQHMLKEEKILFPLIRKMVTNTDGTESGACNTVKSPIQAMMLEHEIEGGRFREIARLTNNYTVPEDACNTYKVTFSLLKEFEEDLHLHIHLENNILFPKAIAMETLLTVY